MLNIATDIRDDFHDGICIIFFKAGVETPIQTSGKRNEFQFRGFLRYPFKSDERILAR